MQQVRLNAQTLDPFQISTGIWPTGTKVPQGYAPEAGLGHQASKDLAPRLETAQADGDVMTVTEEQCFHEHKASQMSITAVHVLRNACMYECMYLCMYYVGMCVLCKVGSLKPVS